MIPNNVMRTLDSLREMYPEPPAAAIRAEQEAERLASEAQAAAEREAKELADLFTQIEAHRGARDDGEKQTAEILDFLGIRQRAEATQTDTPHDVTWAGLVTDYVLHQRQVDALAGVTALSCRFMNAWATATATLADRVSGLPPVDVDDPTDVALWLAEAERVVARALVPVPAPQIVLVPR